MKALNWRKVFKTCVTIQILLTTSKKQMHGLFLNWVMIYFHLVKWSSFSQFCVWRKNQMKKICLKSSLCCIWKLISNNSTAWKVSVLGVFLVRTFPHLEWIWRDTPYLSIFSPNVEKYGPEKLRIRTLFTQCLAVPCNYYLSLVQRMKHPEDFPWFRVFIFRYSVKNENLELAEDFQKMYHNLILTSSKWLQKLLKYARLLFTLV